MNIRMKSTGKVHSGRGYYSQTHHRVVFYFSCNGELPYYEEHVQPSNDPLSCKLCLRIMGKKK